MAVEKKFVEDGLKKARLNDFLASRLERAGYGGMVINRTPQGTQITIFAEKPGMVIGKSGKTIKKLTSDVKQFKLDNPQIEVKEVEKPELNAQMMANRLASALERGWYFRKAGNSTLLQIMDAGALGCEIVLAGKLTGPRKRTQKFVEGYIKHSGKAAEEIVDKGFAVAKKKLGIIGVKVRIVPPGVKLPDYFTLQSELDEIAAAKSGDSQEAEKQDRGEEIVEELLGEDAKKETGESPEQKDVKGDEELDKAVEKAAVSKDKPVEADTVKPKAEVTVKPKAEVTVKPKAEVTVKPKAEVTVKPKAEVTVKPKAEMVTGDDTDGKVDDETVGKVEPVENKEAKSVDVADPSESKDNDKSKDSEGGA
jgi:small subunit ribosomal protein S3